MPTSLEASRASFAGFYARAGIPPPAGEDHWVADGKICESMMQFPVYYLQLRPRLLKGQPLQLAIDDARFNWGKPYPQWRRWPRPEAIVAEQQREREQQVAESNALLAELERLL